MCLLLFYYFNSRVVQKRLTDEREINKNLEERGAS